MIKMTTQEEIIVEKKDIREEKAKKIALERTVYHIVGKDVYYVESESTDNHFYYLSWNPDNDIEWCSCPDYSMRGRRCKHIISLEYAIRKNTLVETEKLPSYARKGPDIIIENQDMEYKNGKYDF